MEEAYANSNTFCTMKLSRSIYMFVQLTARSAETTTVVAPSSSG